MRCHRECEDNDTKGHIDQIDRKKHIGNKKKLKQMMSVK